MAKRTIVEINGRKYDANTGQMVSDVPAPAKAIDGFQAPVVAPKMSVNRTVNQAQTVHSKPERTKKLHPAAAKAARTPKRVMAKSMPKQPEPAPNQSELNRRYDLAVNRQQRAAVYQRSQSIQKFSRSAEAEIAKPIEAIAPVAPVVTQPMPRPQPVQKPKAVPEPVEETLEEVTKEPGFFRRITTKRPRLVPATLAVLAVLLIGGFVTYRNMPNMALRIASSRAGFQASLPGYSPSGFRFAGPVAYSDGVIELEYASNSDDRAYSLTQKESAWDSQSLLDNYVENRTDDYLTFQERGLTVYVYDGSQATWVDRGIWYTIEGDSNLTTEQLLKIASSL